MTLAIQPKHAMSQIGDTAQAAKAAPIPRDREKARE